MHACYFVSLKQASQMEELAQNGARSQSSDQAEILKPAVSKKKSVTQERLICLECGAELKALKKHLKSAHGLTPDKYRSRWSLPGDYPMVAPAYAKKRSELAKSFGLGRKAGE